MGEVPRARNTAQNTLTTWHADRLYGAMVITNESQTIKQHRPGSDFLSPERFEDGHDHHLTSDGLCLRLARGDSYPAILTLRGACIDVAPYLEAVGWDGSGGCICLTDWIVDEIVLETGAAAVIVGNA
eukprot:scaffold1325_cov194-Skeletonema_marinoi.AAC.1